MRIKLNLAGGQIQTWVLFRKGDRVSLPTKVKPKWLTWRIAGWLGLIREEQRIYVVGAQIESKGT